MTFAISVLRKKLDEITLELNRLKNITEFELSSDIEFVNNDIQNLEKLEAELVNVIVILTVQNEKSLILQRNQR
jgi:hypothetical protein